jgi:hypothetical protein
MMAVALKLHIEVLYGAGYFQKGASDKVALLLLLRLR